MFSIYKANTKYSKTSIGKLFCKGLVSTLGFMGHMWFQSHIVLCAGCF